MKLIRSAPSKIFIAYSLYIDHMKTIMIRDDVYRRLVEIKGDKSFSTIIEELIKESKEARNRRLMKFFGILGEDEAKQLEEDMKRAREELNEAFSGHISPN